MQPSDGVRFRSGKSQNFALCSMGRKMTSTGRSLNCFATKIVERSLGLGFDVTYRSLRWLSSASGGGIICTVTGNISDFDWRRSHGLWSCPSCAREMWRVSSPAKDEETSENQRFLCVPCNSEFRITERGGQLTFVTVSD